METKLYYVAPKNEIFNELKMAAIKIWETYDDTYNYATKKISQVSGMENVGDNFMYMVAMFDRQNMKKLSELISEECSKEVRERLLSVDYPNEYNCF